MKGAGGGGGGRSTGTIGGTEIWNGGGGGGEGGTTITYNKLSKGTLISIDIGKGGTGGQLNTQGQDGGSSTIIINGITYSGGGGKGGYSSNITSTSYGAGGFGTIPGNAGSSGYLNTGGSGGGSGNGGSGLYTKELPLVLASTGCGGTGGGKNVGGAGSDGICWIEYYDPNK